MFTPIQSPHAAYIQRELLTASVFNAVLCAFFTYVFVPHAAPVPLWGAHGIAADLVPTVFMLTLIGGTVMTLAARRRLRHGSVDTIPDEQCGWMARRLPRHPAPRILLLALLMTAVVVPVSVAGFWLLGVNALQFGPYLLFKACYGPLAGALSVKPAVQAALRQAGARPHPA